MAELFRHNSVLELGNQHGESQLLLMTTPKEKLVSMWSILDF